MSERKETADIQDILCEELPMEKRTQLLICVVAMFFLDAESTTPTDLYRQLSDPAKEEVTRLVLKIKEGEASNGILIDLWGLLPDPDKEKVKEQALKLKKGEDAHLCMTEARERNDTFLEREDPCALPYPFTLRDANQGRSPPVTSDESPSRLMHVDQQPPMSMASQSSLDSLTQVFDGGNESFALESEIAASRDLEYPFAVSVATDEEFTADLDVHAHDLQKASYDSACALTIRQNYTLIALESDENQARSLFVRSNSSPSQSPMLSPPPSPISLMQVSVATDEEFTADLDVHAHDLGLAVARTVNLMVH